MLLPWQPPVNPGILHFSTPAQTFTFAQGLISALTRTPRTFKPSKALEQV